MKFVFPLSIDFAKSQGSYLHDEFTGQRYLDLFSGYASIPLGYNHPIFDASFYHDVQQVAALRMTNNVMSSAPLRAFLEEFIPHLPSDKVHFTCTGALAVEAAIKTAMTHAHQHRSIAPSQMQVLCLRDSFHGVNAWGFATDRVGVTAKRMEDYPDAGWLHLAIDEALAFLSEPSAAQRTVALLIEPIQATNGDIHLPKAALQALVHAAKAQGICVIVDEIQTGFGVTGTMWYSQQLGIAADILVFGKKAQVCGIAVAEAFASIFSSPYQKLDVTFDGDLIDMIRARYVLKAYQRHGLLENTANIAAFFQQALQPFMQTPKKPDDVFVPSQPDSPALIANFRAAGCLIAFDLPDPALRDRFVADCFAAQLLVNKAGAHSIRLRPNLAITFDEMSSAAERMSHVLTKLR
jgi:L-lysine 6-transaminase